MTSPKLSLVINRNKVSIEWIYLNLFFLSRTVCGYWQMFTIWRQHWMSHNLRSLTITDLIQKAVSDTVSPCNPYLCSRSKLQKMRRTFEYFSCLTNGEQPLRNIIFPWEGEEHFLCKLSLSLVLHTMCSWTWCFIVFNIEQIDSGLDTMMLISCSALLSAPRASTSQKPPRTFEARDCMSPDVTWLYVTWWHLMSPLRPLTPGAGQTSLTSQGALTPGW